MMAFAPIHFLVLTASFHVSAAHVVALEKTSLGVEIGREGQVLMRQDEPKRIESEEGKSLLEKPKHKHKDTHKEAVEAFAEPSKIDDSMLGTIRMPEFIEKYPNFYASLFVGASLLFLISVCAYVQYEDYKESQIRARERIARRQAMEAAAALHRQSQSRQPRIGDSFSPPHGAQGPAPPTFRPATEAAKPSPPASSSGRWTPPLQPAPKARVAAAAAAAAAAVAAEQDLAAFSDAGISDVAFSEAARSDALLSDNVFPEAAPSDAGRSEASRSDAGRSDGARSDSGRYDPMSSVAAAARTAAVSQGAAEHGTEGGGALFGFTDAIGNITGVLQGENVKMPKLSSPFGASTSPDPTTASGTSTPRSRLSSQPSGSAASWRPYSSIQSGTILVARVPEVIFASTTSWQEIGELAPGQQIVADGPPEMVDPYQMVPIKPRGAVDLKTLDVL